MINVWIVYVRTWLVLCGQKLNKIATLNFEVNKVALTKYYVVNDYPDFNNANQAKYEIKPYVKISLYGL